MVNITGKVEFNEERSRLYDLAMREYPNSREEDIHAMEFHLQPKRGDKILGIGEGNGYFSESILRIIGENGEYTVTDPSKYQLANLRKRIKAPNLEIIKCGAEELKVRENYYDKVWSFGAFHHCPNQTEAMKRIYLSLKSGGIAVICDVFAGSKLAEHFDSDVAMYSCTGHEVKFMSKDFAKTLCKLAGFDSSNIKIEDLNQKWKFDSPVAMGDFLYKLHGITKRVNSHWTNTYNFKLDYDMDENHTTLHWPMNVLKAKKF